MEEKTLREKREELSEKKCQKRFESDRNKLNRLVKRLKWPIFEKFIEMKLVRNGSCTFYYNPKEYLPNTPEVRSFIAYWKQKGVDITFVGPYVDYEGEINSLILEYGLGDRAHNTLRLHFELNYKNKEE